MALPDGDVGGGGGVWFQVIPMELLEEMSVLVPAEGELVWQEVKGLRRCWRKKKDSPLSSQKG